MSHRDYWGEVDQQKTKEKDRNVPQDKVLLIKLEIWLTYSREGSSPQLLSCMCLLLRYTQMLSFLNVPETL